MAWTTDPDKARFSPNDSPFSDVLSLSALKRESVPACQYFKMGGKNEEPLDRITGFSGFNDVA